MDIGREAHFHILGPVVALGVQAKRPWLARASLRETSLYELALRCGIDDARAFVQRFIDYERREVRGT